MTTKEQEREALRQIKDILSRLEPDGYVNTAFDGCLADAEDNINNDFMMSWKQRAESAAKTSKQLQQDYADLCKRKEKSDTDYQNAIDRLRNENDTLRKERDSKEKAFMETLRDAVGTDAALKEARETVEKQASEILHLKAKLYDFMTTEGR